VNETYLEKINKVLKKNLTQKSFELWEGVSERISNKCWDKPTSSTGKYHQKEDGRVPSVAEHTWEMIYSADKIIHMFEGVINKDVIFLSIALHDSYKYGLVKTCTSTESRHDHITAEIVKLNRKIYMEALSEYDVSLLEKAIRFHSGRWSTDADKNMYNKFTPEVLFLHTLDMLSSKNLLKVL
jgi:23S rRNA maturation-related 3'-5' exoribonuclease YhaM